MQSYFAHGLNILSEIPLPELPAGRSGADLVIRLGKVARPTEADGAPRRTGGTARQVEVFWEGVGGISVRDGREVVVDPAPGVDERALRLIILGPALGLSLVQRGALVFHASCVSFPEGAAAFLGWKGFGKSTTASALHRRGHDLVTDDVMALDHHPERLLARPGFPQMKLWPDAVAAIEQSQESMESLPRLHPDYEKRSRRISQGFAPESVPLRCVFVLATGPEVEITPLAPTESLLGVIPHWYGAQFGGELLRVLGIGQQLRASAKLVKKAPAFRLRRPLSLEVLPGIAARVEECVARVAGQLPVAG